MAGGPPGPLAAARGQHWASTDRSGPLSQVPGVMTEASSGRPQAPLRLIDSNDSDSRMVSLCRDPSESLPGTELPVTQLSPGLHGLPRRDKPTLPNFNST